jgi:hypothetical protein
VLKVKLLTSEEIMDTTNQNNTIDIDLIGSGPVEGTAIDLAANGILWLKTRSLNFWAKCLFGVFSVGTLGSVFYALNFAPKPEIAGREFDNSLYMSQTSPELLAGITPDTPPLEIIKRLQIGTARYEKLIGQESNKFWQDAYINESHRLRGLASTEAQSGEFIRATPFPAIDLSQCPAKLGDVTRCVLFRMQLEGLNALWEGAKAQDLQLMQRGYGRYKAATIALNPPGEVAIDSDRLVSALIKQLNAHYLLQQAIAPASSNPSLQLRTVPGAVPIPESDRNQLPGGEP